MNKPTIADIEYQFYDKFFFSKNLEPYKVQEESFAHIFAGRSVLITVPTGTGKTLIAKAAIFKAMLCGERAIYTTPLRALTEEKYRELCDDFGKENVGFATGDYKVNPDAPIQVIVAEILWNRIFGDRVNAPADVVVMDEGHYFNDPERGYTWEQSIIGLDPRSQLIILSATVGQPEQFCAWVYQTRRVSMEVVRSDERKVPLLHQYKEVYVLEEVKRLFAEGEYPTIIFTFSREQCFERARLLKSCPRFTSDAERDEIIKRVDPVLLGRGLSEEMRSYLIHGIGIHHAGILPRYKQLVEQLTLDRLVKFVISTETISAGINLPAKRVVFPSLRKHIQGKARLLLSAEYHQMSGRAGRPQFDTEGISITLAPEEVVQDARKLIKDAQKGRYTADEKVCWAKAYSKAKATAQQSGDITWDKSSFEQLVHGIPAPLTSKTKVTAEQILAIGLPDLAAEGEAIVEGVAPVNDLPASQNLNIRTVIANLLLPERDKLAALKLLGMITNNLRAMGILDEHGVQVKGHMINRLRGIDGPFVYYALTAKQLEYEEMWALCEYLIDHDAVWKIITRKDDDKKREWIKNRLRERRREEGMVSWEDVEEEYDREFPRELTPIEKVHAEFVAPLPHQELHGGKKAKKIWAMMEEEQLGFMDFVEKHSLAFEEGNLFTYLARVMKVSRQIFDATEIDEFKQIEDNVRKVLSVIDERVLSDLW
jgi:superfamily II DNA/RNA helicase